MLFLLAFRNIFANKRRSIVVFLVLTFVCSILFLFMTFSDGEIQNFRNMQAAFYPVTDAIVINKEYAAGIGRGESKWEKTIADYPAVLEQLQAFPEVENAFVIQPVLGFDIIAHKKKYPFTPVTGIEAEGHKHIFDTLELEAGRFFEPGDKYVALMRPEQAARAGISLKDEIYVTGKDLFSQAVSQKVKVVGFVSPKMDNPNISEMGYLDMDAFCMVSGFYAGEANRIGLTLKKGVDIAAFNKKYNAWAEKENPGLLFSTEEKVFGESLSIYKMLRYIFIGCVMIVLLIVSIGIMNVVSVNLYDRKKEIGTYYCLGAGKAYLTCMYTVEMLIVNMLGAIAGIGLGLGLRQIIEMMNITTTEPGVQLVFGGSRFTLGFSLDSIITIVAGIFFVTLFSALFTLKGSLKVSPSVAIRETGE
jgi:ABC-type lipoprotein release transport system permease subunit